MHKKLVLVIFLLSVFMIGFLPVKDTDFGWHYRCGKDLLELGIPCTTNRFSYFLANYKAYNPSFLYDAALSLTYDKLGFLGVSVLGGIIFSLIAFTFIKLLNIPLWLKMSAYYVVFFLSSSIFNLGLRSQILTILFFLIILALVQNSQKKITHLSNIEKSTWKNPFSTILFFPLVMFIWVNTHIGFFLGLVIILFWFLEKLTVFLQTKTSEDFNKSLLVGKIFGLSFLATLINPFGINVYREIANHAFSPLNTMIAEWVPPSPEHKIIIILSAIIIFISIISQNHISLFKILLLGFYSILAIKARRNLPLFYLVIIYLFFKLNRHRLQQILTMKMTTITDRSMLLLSSTLSIAIILFSIPRFINTINFDRSWTVYCSKGLSVYPCLALEHNPQLKGNIFAAYEWGGFLIWQVPKTKIFADGRMPAWKDEKGSSPYQVYLYIIQAREGWNEKLRKLKTDYLLIQTGTFLDLLLQNKAEEFGWKEQYRDKIAVLYNNRAK